MDSRFDKITPKDVISGAFYSDGPKTAPTEKSGSERMSALAEKKIREEMGGDGVEIKALNISEISDPDQAMMALQVGMMIANKAMAFLDGANLLMPDETSGFDKGNRRIHKTFRALVARLQEEKKS